MATMSELGWQTTNIVIHSDTVKWPPPCQRPSKCHRFGQPVQCSLCCTVTVNACDSYLCIHVGEYARCSKHNTGSVHQNFTPCYVNTKEILKMVERRVLAGEWSTRICQGDILFVSFFSWYVLSLINLFVRQNITFLTSEYALNRVQCLSKYDFLSKPVCSPLSPRDTVRV